VGFLAYPISQAADITAFKAELVPVGDDQLPMIEQTNEIVHKMNSLTTTPILRHCSAAQRRQPPAGHRWQRQNVEIAGEHAHPFGQRSPPCGQRHIPTRITCGSPTGQTEGNVVFTYLDAFHADKTFVAEMKAHYRRGGLGDRQCKNALETCHRSCWRRYANAGRPIFRIKACCWRCGSERAHELTQRTLHEVKRGLGLPVLF
jgi:tryptophanyl-tRNA synthetase